MSTTIETIMNSKGAMLALAIIAFLMAAVLVLVIVRMLFGGRLRMPGGRARQARLGIVDAFDLDRQRQLIIVRRDNTEHLIMIGGPNDLLIESEIVRIEARDLRRDKTPEFMGAPGDGRIPAPFALPMDSPDAPDLGTAPHDPMSNAVVGGPQFTSPEPSSVASTPVSSAAVDGPLRAPTFPLPPRRPPPLPERRPMPSPRAPDEFRNDTPRPLGPPVSLPVLPPGVNDGADRPSSQNLSSQSPSIQVPSDPPMTSPVAIDTASPVSTGQPTVPAMPLVAPAPATPRTLPPSFLKPLPPRPPIRPLGRTNPKPPIAPTSEPGSPPIAAPPSAPVPEPTVEAPPPPVPVEAAPLNPAPAPKPSFSMPPFSSPPAPTPPHEEPKDALESLEEEMAKLLGRGPGA